MSRNFCMLFFCCQGWVQASQRQHFMPSQSLLLVLNTILSVKKWCSVFMKRIRWQNQISLKEWNINNSCPETDIKTFMLLNTFYCCEMHLKKEDDKIWLEMGGKLLHSNDVLHEVHIPWDKNQFFLIHEEAANINFFVHNRFTSHLINYTYKTVMSCKIKATCPGMRFRLTPAVLALNHKVWFAKVYLLFKMQNIGGLTYSCLIYASWGK